MVTEKQPVWYYDGLITEKNGKVSIAPRAPAIVTRVHWPARDHRPADVNLRVKLPGGAEDRTMVPYFEEWPSKVQWPDGYPGGWCLMPADDEVATIIDATAGF